jgi:hypothetical protein
MWRKGFFIDLEFDIFTYSKTNAYAIEKAPPAPLLLAGLFVPGYAPDLSGRQLPAAFIPRSLQALDVGGDLCAHAYSKNVVHHKDAVLAGLG